MKKHSKTPTKKQRQCLAEHEFRPRREYSEVVSEEGTGWMSMPAMYFEEQCSDCGSIKIVRKIIGRNIELSTLYSSEASL